MAAGEGHIPDWRDSAAYEPLLHAERSLFAWEWLRRDRGYRAAADRALGPESCCDPAEPGGTPEKWGLHAFEVPDVGVPEARPIWSAQVCPFVLAVEAARPGVGEAFDPGRFAPISTVTTAADGVEHLLISDGLRSIRIDILVGTVGDGPAELRYRLAGLESAERPLLTLQRFLSLWRTGRFCRCLHASEARAKRWILMLRACDALGSGANQRAVAAELLGKSAALGRWRVEAPSLRSRVSAWSRERGGWPLAIFGSC